MTGRRLARAIGSRKASTILVGLVSALAVAAAVAAPTYEAAARTSILHDSFAQGSFVEQGLQVETTGGMAAGAADDLRRALLSGLDAGLGTDRADRLFPSEVLSLEASVNPPTLPAPVPLVSRTDACAHLELVHGRCPRATGEVMVSRTLSRLTGWNVGRPLPSSGGRPLRIVGIYAATDPGAAYWFGRSSTYFPGEHPTSFDVTAGPSYDAAFTTPATMYRDPNRQGTFLLTALIDTARLRVGDVDALNSTAIELGQDPRLTTAHATATTSIPAAVDTIRRDWRSLRVPAIVITATLVLLAWLLLFLLVSAGADARADEVALARLRGQGRAQVAAIAAGEPLVIVLLALPLGVLAGWAGAVALAHASLLPGTDVGLPTLAWLTAAAAVIGGATAAGVAAARALAGNIATPTFRNSPRRGWVLDAIVVTAALAGLLQLGLSGSVSSSNSGVVLLVPALASIAAAIVMSRALPLACRALFGTTSKYGPVGLFLAVRTLARRSSGTRAVALLAAATGLFTFAIAGWSSGNQNRANVAAATVGAAQVLTVTAPPRLPLETAVNRADPGGAEASAVFRYDNGDSELLAVQPQRFARVAAWSAARESAPTQATLAKLHPAAATPVLVTGTQLRVTMSAQKLTTPATVAVDVSSRAGAIAPVDLGIIGRNQASQHLTGRLHGCPCRLLDLNLSPNPVTAALGGTIAVKDVTTRARGAWASVGRVMDAASWRGSSSDLVTNTGRGLLWAFHGPPNASPTLQVADHPTPVPALVSAGLSGSAATTGLDGNALDVDPVATAAVIPGAASGTVVPLDYARLAAQRDESTAVTQQVWLTGNAAGSIERRLSAEGVRIEAVRRASDLAAQLGRHGPGLGARLFLVDATAAMALAALGSAAAFLADGRRRRYEYASLLAARVRGSAIRGAVAIEQVVTLVFSFAVGVSVGWLVALAVLPDLPQFVKSPGLPISYVPPASLIAAGVGAAFAVMVVTGWVTARLFLRGVRPDLLREGA